MNRITAAILATAVATVATAQYWINAQDNAELQAVKTGEKTLYCTSPYGEHPVEKTLVTDFADGVWIFTNGYASNCYTE